jgi:hypothetical protein
MLRYLFSDLLSLQRLSETLIKRKSCSKSINNYLNALYPYTFTQFRTTGNYSVIAILHILRFTAAHALVVSWQRIYNSLTVTSTHTWNLLGTVYLFSVNFFCHLPNSTQFSSSQSQNQSYFTTGGLLPVSSSWRQAPWDSRHSNCTFQLNTCGYSPYVISSLTRGWVCRYISSGRTPRKAPSSAVKERVYSSVA